MAHKSYEEKDHTFLNAECPYVIGVAQEGKVASRMCGSWCALFYFDTGKKDETGKVCTTPHVILGCKAGEKLLYVEEVVGGGYDE